MLEAQRRGHDLFYYRPQALALRDGVLSARGSTVTVRDEPGNHATVAEEHRQDLSAIDVVLLRQDPPFDMAYITTTHLLERIHPATLVVNDPAHVRNAPEKIFVMDYPQFMPPTLITRDFDEIGAFRREFGDIIIKPLYGNGGAGVFRLTAGDQNLAALLEIFEEAFPEPFIAQQYVPAVRAGDKRIILVDGIAVGAINRVPAEGETRSNMHVGGRPEPIAMTARDREICEALGPELRARGLIFVGIDVIGDVLTEINVTSPTGIREVARFGGADIAALIWDAIEKRR
jgi:glutathione synthase